MAKKSSPTVRQRRLAAELRQLRKRSNLSAEEVANRLGWSAAKVYRTEAGETLPPLSHVINLIELYGVDDTTRAALIDLAREARRRGWWTAFTDVLPTAYVSLEDEASRIQAYEAQVMHGLLQSEDYARAVLGLSGALQEDVERRLQARMARKTLLTRPNAPQVEIILDEAVLRRVIGDPEIMRDQMHALRATARRPNVSIRVLPFSAAGAHVDGPMTILTFAPEDPEVIFIEGMGGNLYLEAAHQVDTVKRAYQRIADRALDESESAALIAALAKEG
ncbi:helix-turn-helix transcriptional regulator [Actinoallomurus sp. NPDC052274]|uniref:helix-turn-helix domain-containing protein n=1 Tax=Actinoallomurus sp. NPDC052274 TaxID=3155420 RepID=UPI00344070B0